MPAKKQRCEGAENKCGAVMAVVAHIWVLI